MMVAQVIPRVVEGQVVGKGTPDCDFGTQVGGCGEGGVWFAGLEFVRGFDH